MAIRILLPSVGLVVLGAVLVVASRSDSGSRSQPADWSIVSAELAQVSPLDALFTDFATAGTLSESADASSFVVVVNVTGLVDERRFGSQQRISGLHEAGLRLLEVTVLDSIKGEPPAKLTLEQPAEWFNGSLLGTSIDPPLLPGRDYLIFVKPSPRTGNPMVVGPSVHQVVDGRLYWAGALSEASPDGQLPDYVRYTQGDALFGLWGIKVEDAANEIAKSR